jgi:carbonic anhydrase/acetyltransferase-like protein (isoleucine patch superfamily)
VLFHAVIRGDTAPIRIGAGTNIQEAAILHADPGFPCTLGDGVSVAHRAVVHGATVGDGSLIGIGAIVLNGAVIGRECLIGAGAVVPEGAVLPDRSVALGVPAKIRRECTPEDLARVRHAANHYASAIPALRESGLGR